MAYKLILQEICPECDGSGKINKIEEGPEDYYGKTRFPFNQITCYTCKGLGFVYQEEHLVPELKERIILNFEKES